MLSPAFACLSLEIDANRRLSARSAPSIDGKIRDPGDVRTVAPSSSNTSCTGSGRNQTCTTTTTPATYGSVASWGGCVESRPYPHNIQDTAATTAATLFVPMFAPDETDNTDSSSWPANNDWSADISTGTDAERLRYMPKYFVTGTSVTRGCTGYLWRGEQLVE